MVKRLLLPAAILYTIALTIVSLIDIDGVPKIGFSFDDKIYHFLAYLLLGFLWITFILVKIESTPIIITLFGLIVFGIVLELVQHPFNPNRTFDIFDLIANCLGVLVGTFIAQRFDVLKLK